MEIKFKNERTQLATPGLFRTGFWDKRLKNGESITVLKHSYTGKKVVGLKVGISYDVCLSSGESWSWAYHLNYQEMTVLVNKILK